MAIQLFCKLKEESVFAGGYISGLVILHSSDGSQSWVEEVPNVYFRLIGVESVKFFESGLGVKESNKVFLDTVFNLEEVLTGFKLAENRTFIGEFRFSLPKNLPPSFLVRDIPLSAVTDKTRWIDTNSGIKYTLFASLRPVADGLIEKGNCDSNLDCSKSRHSSMDLFTTFPLEENTLREEFVMDLPESTFVDICVDSFLGENILHRNTIIETVSKKIPGENFFSESKPVTLSVNVDQYSVQAETAFPVFITINNCSTRLVEKIESALIAKVYLSKIDREIEYLISRGSNLDIHVEPNSQIEDLMYWIRLSSDIKLPSTQWTDIIRVTYELAICAHMSGGNTVDVRIPIFVSRRSNSGMPQSTKSIGPHENVIKEESVIITEQEKKLSPTGLQVS